MATLIELTRQATALDWDARSSDNWPDEFKAVVDNATIRLWRWDNTRFGLGAVGYAKRAARDFFDLTNDAWAFRLGLADKSAWFQDRTYTPNDATAAGRTDRDEIYWTAPLPPGNIGPTLILAILSSVDLLTIGMDTSSGKVNSAMSILNPSVDPGPGPDPIDPGETILSGSVVHYPADSIRTYTCSVERVHKGQIVHEFPFVNGVLVLNRGYGSFRGVSVFQEAKGDHAAAIEAFLAALAERQNVTELPIHRMTIPAEVDIKAVKGSAYTLSSVDGVKVGQYARSGARLYQVTGISGSDVSLWPFRPLSVDDKLMPGFTVRAAGRSSVESPLSPDWLGPWTLSWEERS